MSATNKSPNMELPIYVAEDKPTYLGDWNSTMSKIDTTVTATRNVADSAMETASNASNGVATNTESIGALQTDVQLVKSNQTAINEHLSDIDNSITALDAKATKTTSQLNSGDIAFQFGVDSDGNYGYIKAGADTVTPFKTESVPKLGSVFHFSTNGSETNVVKNLAPCSYGILTYNSSNDKNVTVQNATEIERKTYNFRETSGGTIITQFVLFKNVTAETTLTLVTNYTECNFIGLEF